MPRRRKPSTAARQTPRLRPELRPGGQQDDPIDATEDLVGDEPDEFDELDDAEFDRRLTGGPERTAAEPGGTAVGVLLGLGVLLGAIAAFFVNLPILPALVIGGVVGAIVGIVIDRRRAARAQEAT